MELRREKEGQEDNVKETTGLNGAPFALFKFDELEATKDLMVGGFNTYFADGVNTTASRAEP